MFHVLLLLIYSAVKCIMRLNRLRKKIRNHASKQAQKKKIRNIVKNWDKKFWVFEFQNMFFLLKTEFLKNY